MVKQLQRKHLEEDVYELALQRIRRVYDLADTVVVMFSGGKDSTAVLHLALIVARERGKLPLKVFHWDEEAIHPETVEYVRRVYNMPDVDMRWLAHPIVHRNACSRKHPYWRCWDPDKEHLWCRPKPPEAEVQDPTWPTNLSLQEMHPWMFLPLAEYGSTIMLTGVRADESLRRLRSVCMRGKDNFIAGCADTPHALMAKPIYDWRDSDVWTLPHKEGIDFNEAYTIMSRGGVPVADQRVCPPYGDEPLGGLWKYAQFWPHLWEKMIARVPGAATAGRYSRSALYGFGNRAIGWDPEKPQESVEAALLLWGPEVQKKNRARFAQEIKYHYARTDDPIPALSKDSHPASLLSWELLFKIASRGDLKGRKTRVAPMAKKPSPTDPEPTS